MSASNTNIVIGFVIGVLLVTFIALLTMSDAIEKIKNLESKDKKLILFTDSLKNQIDLLKQNETNVSALSKKYNDIDSILVVELNSLKNEKRYSHTSSINELRGKISRILSDSSRK